MSNYPLRMHAIWAVLRYALGPAARHTERFLAWWPLFASVAAVITPGVGFVTGLATPWLVAIGLGILLLLFLRASIHFYREANPEFPQHALKIDPPWYGDVPDRAGAGEEERVLFLPIMFTNREPTRRLSLQFELLWTRGPREPVLGPYRIRPFNRRTIESSLVSPLAVAPETTVEGDLQFHADDKSILEFGDLLDVRVKYPYALFLRVTDHVTGATIERPVAAQSAEEG
jgi:hypothetical protein